MKPLIGVSTSVRGGWRSYLAISFALWRVGASAKRITPKSSFDINDFDALIVGGGDDISASLYGGDLLPNVRLDPQRDALETRLVKKAAQLGLPLLGICRGAQMINVSLGGTLHADIYEVFERAPKLRTVLPRKQIKISEKSFLAKILGSSACCVNALHHQSVKDLGKRLRVSAEDEHGIVQAIEDNSGHRILGVQWHPELMPFSKEQLWLFGWIANSAKGLQDEDQSLGSTEFSKTG